MNRYTKWLGAALMLGISIAPVCAQTKTNDNALGILSPVLPDGLGVNIHFTDPRSGEMEMLGAGGFTWVRMDFKWAATETQKGKYDFSAYDRLMKALDSQHLRPLFILDYGNKLYDDGLSPHTDEGRAAFARWAAAAVTHFKGKDILWEMWNEPNISFWKPTPNVDDYVKLALATGKAIRAADPNAHYIGPACAAIKFPFLKACFAGGLLKYWDAVTVHPYRGSSPETVADDYRKLRLLIKTYAPQGKEIPIISGEWGYSTRTTGVDETTQAQYIVRQRLTNIANGVPLSIWYDWHSDGPDPKENEHNFGVVRYPYFAGRNPVYDPKPAYVAEQNFVNTFKGFRFNKRIDVGDDESYVFLFSAGDTLKLAAWTTASKPRQIVIPASAGKFDDVDYRGKQLPSLTADGKGLEITLTNSPQYLSPATPNDFLSVIAAWERMPLEITGRAPQQLTFSLSLKNPLKRPLTIANNGETKTAQPGGTVKFIYHQQLTLEEQQVPITWTFQGLGSLTQQARFIPLNVLHVTALPCEKDQLAVQIDNPIGEAFAGTLRIENTRGISLQQNLINLEFKSGETQKVLLLPLKSPCEKEYSLTLQIDSKSGETLLKPTPLRYSLLVDFTRYAPGTTPGDFKIIADGDPAVHSTQSIITAVPEQNPPAGHGALQLKYEFDDGWKFVRLVPSNDKYQKIEGQPKALEVWVYANDTGNAVRMRFKDAAGQIFQANGERITWKGWKLVTFPLDGTDASSWDGDHSGRVHYPISFDSVFLVDGTKKKQAGSVYIAQPTLVY